MTGPTPLVSVNMVTYNHERFIGAAVRSVLEQTCKDLELVIVDDGSTDRTAEVVRSFDDPRIIYGYQKNQGPSVAANHGITRCRGKFLALMSGDDVCLPHRLERQLEEYARGGRRVLFANVECIDENDNPLTEPHYATGLFDRPAWTRPQIVERFFHIGNFLNGVTPFTERELFLAELPYDPLLLQMQDFDMWVRMAKKYELYVLPDRLLRYRIRGDNGNLGAPEPDRMIAIYNEWNLILRRFFDGLPVPLFKEAFAGRLRNPDFQSEAEYRCEQAFLYLSSSLPVSQALGLERLYDLLRDPETAGVLRESYQFTPAGFFRVLRTANPMNLFAGKLTTLFVDLGQGWTQERAVTQPVNPDQPRFNLSFDLSGFRGIQALRWDPIEAYSCKVKVEKITFEDASGKVGELGTDALDSNGTRAADGWIVFDPPDPMVFLPLGGDLSRLTIQGRWEMEAPHVSLARFDQVLKETTARLTARAGELEAALAQKEAELRAVLSSRLWRLMSPARAVARWVRRAG